MQYIYCTDSVLDVENEFVVGITKRICQGYTEQESEQTKKTISNPADLAVQTKQEPRQRLNKTGTEEKKQT